MAFIDEYQNLTDSQSYFLLPAPGSPVRLAPIRCRFHPLDPPPDGVRSAPAPTSLPPGAVIRDGPSRQFPEQSPVSADGRRTLRGFSAVFQLMPSVLAAIRPPSVGRRCETCFRDGVLAAPQHMQFSPQQMQRAKVCRSHA